MRRANTRHQEQQTGQPEDAFGAYWLERTAALEKVAEAAKRLVCKPTSPYRAWADLETAIEALDAIQPPACREGDHDIAA